MRRRAKVDTNHAEIVQALRRVGCQVADTSRLGGGFPDLVVYRPAMPEMGGFVLLVEVKSEKGTLTPDQLEFQRQGWPVRTIRSVEEALQMVGAR